MPAPGLFDCTTMPWASSSLRRDRLTKLWTTSSVICTLITKGAGGVVNWKEPLPLDEPHEEEKKPSVP